MEGEGAGEDGPAGAAELGALELGADAGDGRIGAELGQEVAQEDLGLSAAFDPLGAAQKEVIAKGAPVRRVEAHLADFQAAFEEVRVQGAVVGSGGDLYFAGLFLS